MTGPDAFARAIAEIALRAGAVTRDLYEKRAGWVAEKDDRSPVTEADAASEAIILPALEALAPGTPIVSEERASREGAPPCGERFFLVDPLDGTREFLARNGEFTVNIALVEEGAPRLGCVVAPMLGACYLGVVGVGAWRAMGPDAPFAPIAVRRPPSDGLVAVASRSHADAETEAFLARLRVRERRAIGSSLKFCLLAEGAADVYPRFGPTMEWDTAAGQAVLVAAGGRVLDPEGRPLPCRGGGARNGPFVAWGAPA